MEKGKAELRFKAWKEAAIGKCPGENSKRVIMGKDLSPETGRSVQGATPPYKARVGGEVRGRQGESRKDLVKHGQEFGFFLFAKRKAIGNS